MVLFLLSFFSHLNKWKKHFHRISKCLTTSSPTTYAGSLACIMKFLIHHVYGGTNAFPQNLINRLFWMLPLLQNDGRSTPSPSCAGYPIRRWRPAVAKAEFKLDQTEKESQAPLSVTLPPSAQCNGGRRYCRCRFCRSSQITKMFIRQQSFRYNLWPDFHRAYNS